MRELASPTMTPQPPPPPPLPTAAFKLPMLYYGLIVVGTAAVVLTVYNLIVIKWCANVVHDRPGRRRGFVEVTRRRRRSRSLDYPNRNLLSSFSYKKNKDVGDKDIIGRTSDLECAVCLSVFEDGEEVRKLPRCSHSFHAPCIDMWLYSHSDCPLCRTQVIEPRFHPPETEDDSTEHSREGLIGPVVPV